MVIYRPSFKFSVSEGTLGTCSYNLKGSFYSTLREWIQAHISIFRGVSQTLGPDSWIQVNIAI